VDTVDTRRARELATAYSILKSTEDPETPQSERMDACRHALDVVAHIEECLQKRDLLDLMSREALFSAMPLKPTDMVGLRRRVSSSFMAILRSPHINPEIARYEKLMPRPLILSQPRRHRSSEVSLLRCPGCGRHLERSSFPLTSGESEGGGRCKKCRRLRDRGGSEMSSQEHFKALFEDIKKAEEDKGNTTSPVFQLQVWADEPTNLTWILIGFGCKICD